MKNAERRRTVDEMLDSEGPGAVYELGTVITALREARELLRLISADYSADPFPTPDSLAQALLDKWSDK